MCVSRKAICLSRSAMRRVHETRVWDRARLRSSGHPVAPPSHQAMQHQRDIVQAMMGGAWAMELHKMLLCAHLKNSLAAHGRTGSYR